MRQGRQTVTYPTGHTREVFWQDNYCWDIGPFRSICAHPLRGNRICTLSKDHRGRHSSITYCCDGCSNRRRGQPFAYSRDGEYEHGLAFCFLCASPQVNESREDMGEVWTH